MSILNRSKESVHPVELPGMNKWALFHEFGMSHALGTALTVQGNSF